MNTTRASLYAVIALLGCATATVAQAWPTRPVIVISAFSAGNAPEGGGATLAPAGYPCQPCVLSHCARVLRGISLWSPGRPGLDTA